MSYQYRGDGHDLRQKCPRCGKRMTKREAAELGRCADCNAALASRAGRDKS